MSGRTPLANGSRPALLQKKQFSAACCGATAEQCKRNNYQSPRSTEKQAKWVHMHCL